MQAVWLQKRYVLTTVHREATFLVSCHLQISKNAFDFKSVVGYLFTQHLLIPGPYAWHWGHTYRTNGKARGRVISVLSDRNLAQTRLSHKGGFIGSDIQSRRGGDLGLEAIGSRGKDAGVSGVGFVTNGRRGKARQAEVQQNHLQEMEVFG